MKKLHRLLAAVLAAVMALSLLTACGAAPAGNTPEAGAASDASTPSPAEAAPVEEEASSDPGDDADLVLTNGVIETMIDGAEAEAVVVKDGEIVFVGTSADAEAYIGDTTQVIDLEGRMVTPGFIDAHTHDVQNIIQEGAIVYLNETPADIEEYKAVLQAFVDEHPDDAVIYGSGLDLNAYSDSRPTNDWMNEICPNTPVYITTVDLHGCVLNDACLELCGITGETEPPLNGSIYLDDAGDPTGYLSDCSDLLTAIPAQEYTNEEFYEAFLKYQAEANSYGITGVNIGGNNIDAMEEWATFEQMRNNGDLNLRVNADIWAGVPFDQAEADRVVAILDEGQQYNSDFQVVNSVKCLLDGVPEAATAAMLDPYTEDAGKGADWYGPDITPQEDFNNFVATLNAKGYQVQTHSMGDASVNLSVNAYENSIAVNGEGDYRNAIVHLNMVTDEDAKRIGELGVIAAMQPIWWYYDPMFSPLEELTEGTERFNTEYRIRYLMDNGIIISGSVDYPITLDYAPLRGIEVGATQCSPYADQQDDPAYLRNADQVVSVYEMLQVYTVNGAYQMRMDDRIGTIEVGKKADLVVLGDNLLTCDVKDISDVTVDYTISDGRIVYEG